MCSLSGHHLRRNSERNKGGGAEIRKGGFGHNRKATDFSQVGEGRVDRRGTRINGPGGKESTGKSTPTRRKRGRVKKKANQQKGVKPTDRPGNR